MSVLNGYNKYKRYILTSSGYKLCSHWTSSNTVHFDDGKTAQTKVGAIDGITNSLTATSSNVALSAKAGKSLQDQVTTLNTGLTKSQHVENMGFTQETAMKSHFTIKTWSIFRAGNVLRMYLLFEAKMDINEAWGVCTIPNLTRTISDIQYFSITKHGSSTVYSGTFEVSGVVGIRPPVKSGDVFICDTVFML